MDKLCRREGSLGRDRVGNGPEEPLGEKGKLNVHICKVSPPLENRDVGFFVDIVSRVKLTLSCPELVELDEHCIPEPRLGVFHDESLRGYKIPRANCPPSMLAGSRAYAAKLMGDVCCVCPGPGEHRWWT